MCLWVCDPSRGYEAKAIKINGEWECVSFDGKLMGVGFYPTHFQYLPGRPGIRLEPQSQAKNLGNAL